LRSRIRYEYEAKHMLEREGWAVTRSAGSHGPIDLIAMNAEHVMLIQVKSSSNIGSSATLSILVEAVEALREVPAPAGQVSRWLFLRAVPGGWRRECVDAYPFDRMYLRDALARTVHRWRSGSLSLQKF
jgi:Holliday junction resolvase